MTVMQLNLDYDKIKKLRLDHLINDEKLIEAIDSDNKDDFRDLILKVIHCLRDEYGVKFKELYYAKYAYLSDELFDMFSCDCLEEIFKLFGYNIECIGHKDLNEDIISMLNINTDEDYEEGDLWNGVMRIYNDKISIDIYAEESMHDSLMAVFVDTKLATYKKK